MIDDEALTRFLLHDAMEEIEVPAAGPERILAARNALARPRSSPDRRRIRWPHARPRQLAALGFAVVLLFVAGVAVLATTRHASHVHVGGPVARTSIQAAAPPPPAAASGSAASGSAALGGSSASGTGAAPAIGTAAPPPAGSTADAGSAGAATATTPGGSTVTPVPTKVIKTGSVSLVVGQGQLNATMNQLSSVVAGLGGYVQDSQTSAGPQTTTTVPPDPDATAVPTTAPPAQPAVPGEAPSGSATLRVPVAAFASLLSQVQTLGRVTSVSSSGQDVTSQYVDLQAQIQALQVSRTQFLKVLAQAQSISDILAVEAQITPLESQIEQLQGQEKVLADQTSYGTLSVAVTETVPAKAKIKPPPPPRPPSGLTKAWHHARHSFSHGLESVVSASGGIGVFLICVLALYLVGRIGWRLTRRRML